MKAMSRRTLLVRNLLHFRRLLFNATLADTDNDVEKLIEKTEVEGDHEEKQKEGGAAFSFAKIWAADKDSLEELDDEAVNDQEAGDSWAQTLERIKLEQLKEKEHIVTGRGARRRAAALFPQVMFVLDALVNLQLICRSSKISTWMILLLRRRNENPSPSPSRRTRTQILGVAI
jgi:hypothetical protein